MFDFLKRSKKPESSEPALESTNPSKPSLFNRFKQQLQKTRSQFAEGIANLVLGKKTIDQELLDEIEEKLLLADLGVDVTEKVINDLTQKISRKELNNGEMLLKTLKDNLIEILLPSEKKLIIDSAKKPFVILVVGVNGAGKTTTIGKLAKRLQVEGQKVLLAAGDTFRAAAVEQLQTWGERNQIPVIIQQQGADSASVIFDAFQAAKARNVDVLIADTAGRLHTQVNLMEELKKVKRVLTKLDPESPHEVLLVLDAGIGQNALNQALQFHQAINVTGLVITKLDGTAKGGIIFAIADKTHLPVRLIGIGEDIDDLCDFKAEEFVQALWE